MSKIEQLSEELQPMDNSFIMLLIPEDHKELTERDIDIPDINNKEREMEIWLKKTDYHPYRGIVISVGHTLKDKLNPGDFIYFAKKMTLQPFIYDGIIFHRGYIGDIISVVKSERGTRYKFDSEKINDLFK